ncbi:MAG TPA: metallophosphoesterase, partial [Thermoanaerobaculia bacterium]|nr:metallophosphoesterase [Thermoanaerobaculia bacterium]
MFFLLALAIWTVMHVYVLWRVRSVPFVRRLLPRWMMIAAGVLLASSYIAARLLEAIGMPRIGTALEWIGAEWMGALVIALGCFFVADIVTGFGFVLRSRTEAFRTIALVASVLLTIAAVLNALRPPVVRNHEVRIANLPADRDGAVVAVISDLHLGTLTTDRWLAARIDQVEALHPDLVLIAGDLVEGDGPPESEMPQLLTRLRAPLGVWAVPGNHERH